jgi:hypothetical protein
VKKGVVSREEGVVEEVRREEWKRGAPEAGRYCLCKI